MGETRPLTKEEKETICLYNQTNEPVNIFCYDPHLLRKLASYSERHPDLCCRVDKHRYPDYAEYEIQRDRISIRLLEPISEERKRAAAQQLNENKKSVSGARGCLE